MWYCLDSSRNESIVVDGSRCHCTSIGWDGERRPFSEIRDACISLWKSLGVRRLCGVPVTLFVTLLELSAYCAIPTNSYLETWGFS